MRLIDADALMQNIPSEEIIAKMAVVHAPSIERRRGEWIGNNDFGESNTYECSVCGEPWELNYGTPEENNMNFCPNCGADMRGE